MQVCITGLDDASEEMIKAYAKETNVSISTLIKQALIDYMGDEANRYWHDSLSVQRAKQRDFERQAALPSGKRTVVEF
jgi:hypothetical protein